MGNPLHILFDNWSFIEFTGNVVSSSAYQLHSSFVRLMIWLCALEPWQKGMMDIDATAQQP